MCVWTDGSSRASSPSTSARIEVDASARRIVLVAEREVSGACLQTEAAVHARADSGARSGERSAGDRAHRRARNAGEWSRDVAENAAIENALRIEGGAHGARERIVHA